MDPKGIAKTLNSTSMVLRNIQIIFIICAVGMLITFIGGSGAAAAGYFVVIFMQAMWIITLSGLVSTNHKGVVFFNIFVTVIQLVCIWYIFSSIKVNSSTDELPKEYKIYDTLAKVLVSVGLLLQYFMSKLIVNPEQNRSSIMVKFVLALLNCWLLVITVSRIRVINTYFVITDG
jgi:hypothetical protein